ncbi:serine hydrolase domain-containing protein [Alteromonas flava]|uniref:serine hydrolase domain-containing protein n=1 Tax=Alteromonas flava TaxID=2048003 RepID=UPI0013D93097|nr:serine hydrolase domain-containing protein [Alteromonas flava]
MSVILVILLASCGGGSDGQTSAPPPTNTQPPAPQLSASEILQQAAQNPDVAGIMVYLQQADAAPQQYAAGVSNRMTANPMQTDQLFKVASISKLFIAIAATRLIADERLGMDDTLATWLPEYTAQIENAEGITLRQLIMHRSGVPDFDSQTGFSWQNAHTSLTDTLAYALNKPADFAPDSRYEYSNTNYLLLGLILDRVLTFSHHQYIQDELLTPLGMYNTYGLQADAPQEQLVHGYWQGVDRKTQTYAIPGGSMVSSVDDIGRFIRALNDGSLFSAQEAALYPYFYNHSGWLPGYQSIATYLPNSDTVLVIFVNSTGGNSEAVLQDTFDELLKTLM